VGWFQDGCEFGPRALGRRSILADPRNAEVGRFINAEIKFREDFRPFAPSVIREEVQTYWHRNQDSPYMILVDQVRNEWRDTLKSVVHQDGSSRVQTVTPDWNPKYYNLLKEFQSITGLPVLLNTSFNRRGMPIVETPKDAVDFFFSCKLDYLVIDNFIVEK
jgi:carbamoyltransferase